MNSEDIIKAFRQGGTGNCVSIAVIKAGIEVFGIGNVIYFKDSGKGGYSFIMRDGFEAELSAGEVEQAIMGSKFILLQNKEVFDYANLCFAAMAKRALSEENEFAKTYQQAIESLNNGEYYFLGADWIGLKHFKRETGLKFIWNTTGVIGASPKHCFFCSGGVVDDYGTPNPINWIERLKYKLFRYYRIADQPSY